MSWGQKSSSEGKSGYSSTGLCGEEGDAEIVLCPDTRFTENMLLFLVSIAHLLFAERIVLADLLTGTYAFIVSHLSPFWEPEMTLIFK